MGVLTADMKRVVEEQRLGYVATVCPTARPISRRRARRRYGTTTTWCSRTSARRARWPISAQSQRRDQRRRSVREEGYRFKGVATILESGPPHQQGIAFYQARGSRVDLFKEIVLVRVQTTQPIDSPAYDLGMTEDEVRDRWERHFQSIRGRGTSVPTGE